MRRRQSRELIVDVDRRWREQYPEGSKWETEKTKAIYDRLRNLDRLTASSADVSAIIGNTSWSMFLCAECSERVEVVVSMGRYTDDYECREYCLDCLRKAVAIGDKL